MRLLLSLTLILLIFSAPGLAQLPVANPGNKFAWGQEAGSLAEAQGYTYRYYLDGSAQGFALFGVACSGSGPEFTCIVPIPNFTQGNHSIQLTAADGGGESPKSSPFAFAYVIPDLPPSAPTGLRIVQ